VDQIKEADALYEKGLELMRRGGHGVPVIYRQDRMIEAAETFRDLIKRFPSSDKIDDAAFLCGEIHKEYLPGQEQIAVKWYERTWTWNPETPHPARFQAAVVYDYRLHDRNRALELYQSVVRNESANKSNVRFATRRIHELTGGTRRAQATNKP
jgi:TolA-binding protein